MQQLTGMDASFLALETANTTGHVGGLSVLDPSTASEPLTLARLTEVMAERLPLAPVLRRKLLNVPLGLDQPYWIDDAAVDGVSGTELLTVLFDLTPAGRELPAAEPFQPERPPPLPVLAARTAIRLAWRPVQTVRITNELVRLLPTLAPPASTLVGEILGLNRGDGAVIATRPGRAPATPFNQAITPHRRFAFRSVDLDTVKTVKKAFGVSVNDVVMAICAGALRRWLID